MQFDEQASQLCGSAAAGGCSSWRQAVGCTAAGERDPLQDRPCDNEIQPSQAGYCECDTPKVNLEYACDHEPFTCAEKCTATKEELVPCGQLVKATKAAKQALIDLVDGWGFRVREEDPLSGIGATNVTAGAIAALALFESSSGGSNGVDASSNATGSSGCGRAAVLITDGKSFVFLQFCFPPVSPVSPVSFLFLSLFLSPFIFLLSLSPISLLFPFRVGFIFISLLHQCVLLHVCVPPLPSLP